MLNSTFLFFILTASSWGVRDLTLNNLVAYRWYSLLNPHDYGEDGFLFVFILSFVVGSRLDGGS